MTYLESGFNHLLERPVPKPEEQSEFDAESYISGLSGSSIIGGLTSSLNGRLNINYETGEITSSDGIINRKILPSPEVIVDATGGGDFTNIQAAIDYAEKIGGATLFLKAGTYRPDAYIALKENTHLIGQDPEKTIIDFSGTTLAANAAGIFAGGDFVTNRSGSISGTAGSSTITGVSTQFSGDGVKENDTFYINNHPYRVHSVVSDTQLTLKEPWRGPNFTDEFYAILRPVANMSVQNLTLMRDRTGSNNGGILFTYCEKLEVNKVRVRNFSGDGITIEDCFNFTLTACEVHNCKTGIEVHTEESDTRASNGAILNCLVWGNSNRGINIEREVMLRIANCTANGNNLGIRLEADEVYVGGCNTEFNALDGIRVVGDSNQIVGNNASSNGDVGITIYDSGSNHRNVISGNSCNSNADYAIFVDGSDTTISGNACVMPTNSIGIHLADDASYCAVTGNSLDGVSNAGTTGISIASGASANKTNGNTFDGLTTNVSDSGTDTIRATRFVSVEIPITIININPADTNWADVDCSGSVGSDTYAVVGVFGFKSSTVGRNLYVRVNGSSDAQLLANNVSRTQIANLAIYTEYTIEVDSNGIFEQSVNNADVTALVFNLRGYWEYTD